MLDGAVSFDVERYSHVPDTLHRVARALEVAATSLDWAGDPVGRRAAVALDDLAGWVRGAEARAADRWAQLLAIPGFDRFDDWVHRPGGGSFVYDLRWIARGDDGPMYTYEELQAMALLLDARSLLDHRAGADVAPEAIDRAMAALGRAGDPAVAAALLGLIGADGFRRLYSALADSVGDARAATPDDAERLESAARTISTLFATASRSGEANALYDEFLDGVLGPEDPEAVDDREIDALQQHFATLDLGREVLERIARLSGVDRAVVLFEGLQGPFILFTAAMPVLDLLQHGVSGEFVGSAMSTGLNVAAYLAESGPLTFVLLTAGVFVQLIAASADDPRIPPRPVLSPDAPNPGGSHYPFYVDEAGVPVAPG